jgi:hypothetical protein
MTFTPCSLILARRPRIYQIYRVSFPNHVVIRGVATSPPTLAVCGLASF